MRKKGRRFVSYICIIPDFIAVPWVVMKCYCMSLQCRLKSNILDSEVTDWTPIRSTFM